MRTRVLALTFATSIASVLALVWHGSVDAVSTRSFVLDTGTALAAGELDGTAVHSNGSVTTGAEVRRLGLDDVALAWSFARAEDGAVYVGTGNEGKIYRLEGDDLSEFAATEQLVVSALAMGSGGTLYAGTLPEGRIYSVSSAGEVSELVQLEDTEHVWALSWDGRSRTLYAATGPEGKVFGIDTQGRAEVYWDSEAGHVMSLARDTDGTLYAGTSDEALLVRLRGPGQVEVVQDFDGNEVTAIAVRDGSLVVAANEFPDPPRATASKTKTTTPARPRPGKGRVYRVASDGRSERILHNDDGHYSSVQLAEDGTVYAGAGKDGRIYRVAPDLSSAVWIDVDERQVLAIDLLDSRPLFLTGDGAAVYRVVPGRPSEPTWTSKVLDAEFRARFGELAWRGSGPLSFRTRSGNTAEPDTTWSEWSAPMATPGPVRSPAGRFLQVRAQFPQSGDSVLLAVTAYYLPQNQRARVHSVGLKSEASSTKNKAKASARSDAPAAPSAKYKLGWKVTNPDQDRLRYRLRFRAEQQTVWRDMLEEHVTHTDTDYEWDTSGVPDGHYVVEVEASDELANPEAHTLRSRAESEPLLIDNHAPRIDGLRANGSRIIGRAVDSLGPIARLEYAVDGGPWTLFFPTDHLLDTASEHFDLRVQDLAVGSHIIAVKATDAGGNSVTAETELRVTR